METSHIFGAGLRILSIPLVEPVFFFDEEEGLFLVREVVLDDVINLLEEWLEIDLSRYGTEIGSMMREYQQPVDEQS